MKNREQNYKHLSPIYRTRFNFMLHSLDKIYSENNINKRYLNLGSGEGDLDFDINKYCKELYACDINESDIAFSKKTNSNIFYSLQNAEYLDYEDNYFDTVICMEVIEHVSHREKVISEINRVLKPNGFLIITFPSKNYPFTYDPINYFLKNFNIKLSIGAHSFGHEDLIVDEEIDSLFDDFNFEIIDKKYLSRYISSICEMYWVGFAQRLLKNNSKNMKDEIQHKFIHIRPTKTIFHNFWFTNLIIYLDELLFINNSKKSVGLGYLLKNTH